MPASTWNGRTVLVTGAAIGIAAHAAHGLRGLGATVVGLDRTRPDDAGPDKHPSSPAPPSVSTEG